MLYFYKHENLSSGPQNPQKARYSSTSLCQHWEGGDRRTLRLVQPASLEEPGTPGSVRDPVSKDKVESNRSHLRLYTHKQEQAHPHVHVQTYITHKKIQNIE